MRELARLKIVLKKSTTITDFIDLLTPEMYGHLVSAAKIISGYNPETKTFRASSLALHIGSTLKFVCDIAKKTIITRNPLFLHLKTETKQKIDVLQDIITNHWCNDLSNLANKCLNEKKWKKLKLLPLTADINTFNNYVASLADTAYEKLQNGEEIENNYKILAECVLTTVLVFNRKRVGEIQFLEIQAYERDFENINQEETLNSLTELEKTMSATFKRVVVFGKDEKEDTVVVARQLSKIMRVKKRKRTCIENYIEVVERYNLQDFRCHFRLTKTTFKIVLIK
ncbi:hypothetical protein RN001_005959 [Aquatica leii]|uniref:Uncharacterized protein n=1 Tax=Aquatica leii TaxID=1421715 RepID=A0AAN7P787_9COLE|nr:hypothetical protein RN001_005959 [Aquatica leii]